MTGCYVCGPSAGHASTACPIAPWKQEPTKAAACELMADPRCVRCKSTLKNMTLDGAGRWVCFDCIEKDTPSAKVLRVISVSQVGHEQHERETMNKSAVALAAAERWWVANRPYKMTQAEHIDDPIVSPYPPGVLPDDLHRLAKAVAEMLRERAEDGRR